MANRRTQTLLAIAVVLTSSTAVAAPGCGLDCPEMQAEPTHCCPVAEAMAAAKTPVELSTDVNDAPAAPTHTAFGAPLPDCCSAGVWLSCGTSAIAGTDATVHSTCDTAPAPEAPAIAPPTDARFFRALAPRPPPPRRVSTRTIVLLC